LAGKSKPEMNGELELRVTIESRPAAGNKSADRKFSESLKMHANPDMLMEC